MTAAADWRNPHQTYTNKYEHVAQVAGQEKVRRDRKDRKAAELQSNVLTHEDDALKQERTDAFDPSKQRVFMASNATWSAQDGYAKPQNKGKVDAYKLRQNELSSNVLPQTDYSEYKPVSKKKADMNNYGHKVDGPPQGSPNKKPNKGLLSSFNNWLNTTDTRQ